MPKKTQANIVWENPTEAKEFSKKQLKIIQLYIPYILSLGRKLTKSVAQQWLNYHHNLQNEPTLAMNEAFERIPNTIQV